MSKKISVIDYGVGNLFSVVRAFENQGASVKIIQTPDEIMQADALVFPGVGAFKEAVKSLQSAEIWQSLRDYAGKGRPFFGICLGMQMLLDQSHEFGLTEGLGLIPGEVVSLPEKTTTGELHKVPAIGWYPLKNGSVPWEQTLLDNITDQDFVYFVHSFYANTKFPENVLAYVEYGGHDIPAAIIKDNVMGCQFHPERSGPSGLKIIENFLRICQ